METIVDKFILQLEAQLTERRVAFTLSPEARAWLAKKGYDRVYGARPLARVIQTEVRDPLTDEILFGRLEQGGTVTIALEGEKLTFVFEPTPSPAAPERELLPGELAGLRSRNRSLPGSRGGSCRRRCRGRPRC